MARAPSCHEPTDIHAEGVGEGEDRVRGDHRGTESALEPRQVATRQTGRDLEALLPEVLGAPSSTHALDDLAAMSEGADFPIGQGLGGHDPTLANTAPLAKLVGGSA